MKTFCRDNFCVHRWLLVRWPVDHIHAVPRFKRCIPLGSHDQHFLNTKNSGHFFYYIKKLIIFLIIFLIYFSWTIIRNYYKIYLRKIKKMSKFPKVQDKSPKVHYGTLKSGDCTNVDISPYSQDMPRLRPCMGCVVLGQFYVHLVYSQYIVRYS